MKTEHIEKKFQKMGARVQFRITPRNAEDHLPLYGPSTPRRCTLDIDSGTKGEVFVVNASEQAAPDLEFTVLDFRPRDRHLLLMIRDADGGPHADVYVRGRVTHPDHKTLVIPFWHRVVPNTENEAAAGRNLVFLD